MPRRFRLSKTVSDLFGAKTEKSVSLVAERFLQVFCGHGLETAQIPRLFDGIAFSNLQSSEKLLQSLTPELLDKTAKLFNVNPAYLDGSNERLYDYLAAYKSPRILLNTLRDIWKQPQWAAENQAPLRILATDNKLDRQKHQVLVPVLLEPIARLHEQIVYRYHVFQDGYSWDYAPTRIELKAIARTVFKALRKPIPIYLVSPKDMDALLVGELIPHSLFRQRSLITDPSLEDYALSTKESAAAKETDELPAVLEYMKETGLDSYEFPQDEIKAEVVVSAEPEMPPALAPKQTNSGKRQAAQEIWDAIRVAASTIWTTERLTIQDMIQRLKGMPHLKAAALSDSAIRKHINDLAPEGIRGKSGRKPKKST